MFTFTTLIRLYLILLEMSYISRGLRLGPFGIYQDYLQKSSLPFASFTNEIHSSTTQISLEQKLRLSTEDAALSNKSFSFSEYAMPQKSDSHDCISSPRGHWDYFKSNVLPVCSLLAFLSSTLFFSYKTWRLLMVHYKYRKFRFNRRTAAERAAVQTGDAIIEMAATGQSAMP